MKVAFYKRGKSFFGKLIRFYTRGPYSHSELVFSTGACFSSHEADGGTRFKAIDLNPDEWDILDVPMTAALENMVRTFCAAEDGCGYDWRGISFSFLPIPVGWQHPDKWFCSEICTAGLQLAGYLSGYTPASLSPNGLYKALKKELEAKK